MTLGLITNRMVQNQYYSPAQIGKTTEHDKFDLKYNLNLLSITLVYADESWIKKRMDIWCMISLVKFFKWTTIINKDKSFSVATLLEWKFKKKTFIIIYLEAIYGINQLRMIRMKIKLVKLQNYNTVLQFPFHPSRVCNWNERLPGSYE